MNGISVSLEIVVRLFFRPFASLNILLSVYIMEEKGWRYAMREKKNHLYVDNQERSILLHSLVELKNQLRRPELTGCHYGRGKCGYHDGIMTESSLSFNLLSCASKRLRTELFSTSLFGNIYSSTDTSNIVMS